MSERTNPVPDGYTHVELPKPQAHGWVEFWETLGAAQDDEEEVVPNETR